MSCQYSKNYPWRNLLKAYFKFKTQNNMQYMMKMALFLKYFMFWTHFIFLWNCFWPQGSLANNIYPASEPHLSSIRAHLFCIRATFNLCPSHFDSVSEPCTYSISKTNLSNNLLDGLIINFKLLRIIFSFNYWNA